MANQLPKTIINHGCPKQIPGRGPNGRKFCRWCHLEVPKGRHSWCNYECQQYGDFNTSKRIVLIRDQDTCTLCDAKKTPKRMFFDKNVKYVQVEVDHIVPVAEGGTHHPDNLRTLCSKCHKEITKNQAQERAERRKIEKLHSSSD